MSAPHIPNLLAGRGGPRIRGGRGRGRGRGRGIGAEGMHDMLATDRSVQATDTDAAVSRLSAVNVGFLDDPYASHLVRGEAVRRLPIINRGTYTRTTALDKLVDSFISSSGTGNGNTKIQKQIISLGAGTDTRYFRLREQNKHQNIIYHEFDFPSVSHAKWLTVSRNQVFSPPLTSESLFPNPETRQPVPLLNSGEEWGYKRSSSSTPGSNPEAEETEIIYICHSLDLRQLPSLDSTYKAQGLRTDIPTLIISECCLCYLEVEKSKGVVKYFADQIPSLGLALYEPIGPDDSFGRMMVANLAARNITMPSLKVYKTIEEQRERLRELGLGSGSEESREGAGDGGGQEGKTIYKIWEDWIPMEEKERLDALDGLDEVEEWEMLAKHYAIVWGWRGTGGWEGWSASPESTPP